MRYLRGLIFVCILLMPLAAYGAGTAMYDDSVFEDVSDTHWAKKYIHKLFVDGFLNGYPDGTFRPNKEITLAEFVVLTCRATLIESQIGQSNHWAAGYMEAAVDHGLFSTTDFPRNTWDKPILRQDMAFITARAMTLTLKEEVVEKPERFLSKLWDWGFIPEGRQKEVAQLWAKGIVAGSTDNWQYCFRGEKRGTRAEAAAMIDRLIHLEDRIVPSEIQWGYDPTRDPVPDHLIQSLLIEHWDILNEARDSFGGQEFLLRMDSADDMALIYGHLEFDLESRELLTRLYDECYVFEVEAYYIDNEDFPELDGSWNLLFIVVGNGWFGQGVNYRSTKRDDGPSDYGAPNWLMGEDYVGEWSVCGWDTTDII